MQRIDANRVLIGHDVELFANANVEIDRRSVDEIIRFATIRETIETLRKLGFLPSDAEIERMILTPDFHRGGGAGIPIGTVFRARGFVMPRAVGNDICCGMRFLVTDVTRDEWDSLDDRIEPILRYIFFEGGRHIALSRQMREAIFWGGLPYLLDCGHPRGEIYDYWDFRQQRRDLERTHQRGVIPASGLFDLQDFIRGSGDLNDYTYDDQIGSIGGGNHFCEFQVVEEVFDRQTAWQWDIKAGEIALMVHSGSVGIGHQVGNHFTDRARSLYPAGLRHEHDFYVLPPGVETDNYLSAMGNAANFAFANRLFLGLMMIRALSEALGRPVYARLVYDAPHNLIWRDQQTYLHRKGACPAGQDEPVIIPGSMGSSSYVMIGQGNDMSLCSACHGAGRLRPRQQGRQLIENPCRVVTKIDPRTVRRDIRDDYLRALAEEAPHNYKAITPVIETVEGAGIARRVARTFPLLTVKGL